MLVARKAAMPTIESPYSGGVRMMDADSHIMEPPGWLDEYCDDATRAALRPLTLDGGSILSDMQVGVEEAKQRVDDPEAAAELDRQIMTAKGWRALGAWDPAERSHALDIFGFESQLVFSTFAKYQFSTGDDDVLIGGTRALNRGMNDFCSSDDRLAAVGATVWVDPAVTLELAVEALDGGAGALLVPATPGALSPTHPDYDPLWSMLEERGVPFLLHIAGFGNLLNRNYLNNGHPTEDPFGENMRGKEYMAVHQLPEQFLSSMILDGVFDQHPDLLAGCIELTGAWVVPWLRRLDHCQVMWGKGDDSLGRLTMKASDYVHRNIFVTPFPGEPVGWMIEQCGDDIFMFSTDFPHREGTSDPLGVYEETMDRVTDAGREGYYWKNYVRMMGLD